MSFVGQIKQKTLARIGEKTMVRRVKPEPALPPFCLNCGTQAAKFCPECGQENTPHAVHMSELFRDVWDEFVKADNKFFRTIFALLFRPGMVTKQYAEGKRTRYLSPFRLYLTVSALFFFVLSQQVPLPSNDENVTFGQQLAKIKAEDKTRAAQANEKAKETKKGFSINVKADEKSHYFTFFGRPIDWKGLPDSFAAYETKQTKLPAQKRDDWVAAWASKRIIALKSYTPQTFLAHLLDTLPKIMFVNMPLFALVLKILYFRGRWRYVQHFVFSLHVHTVYFVLMGVVMLMLHHGLFSAFAVLAALILIPFYLFFALKTMYGQGTPKTLLKLLLLTQAYSFVQFIASLLTFLFSLMFLS